MTLHIEVITPEKVVYEGEIDEVVVPTTTGQIGILPNHASLLSRVASGELIIKQHGREHLLAVHGGFLEVGENKVTILADYAVRSEDIETAKVLEAKKRAEKLMQEKSNDRDFAQAESELRRALLELKVAERRKSRPITSTQ